VLAGESVENLYNEGKDLLYQWKRVGDILTATGNPIEATVSNTYEVAKAEGAPHHGWLKQYEKLPDHLIQKSIRSIQKQIQEHEAWIKNPTLKLGDVNQVDPRALSDYIHHKWPSDIQRQKEQLSILQGILEARS